MLFLHLLDFPTEHLTDGAEAELAEETDKALLGLVKIVVMRDADAPGKGETRMAGI